MTTVSNVEDRLPYVEPPVMKTSLQHFRESLRDSADVESEEAVFFRTEKEWAKAATHQRTATELERIARCADPQKELQETMDRMMRLYADLKAAQVDAHQWTVNAMKRQQNKLNEASQRSAFVATAAGEVTNTNTGEIVAEHVPSAADVWKQEQADKARTEAVQKGLAELEKAKQAPTRRRNPRGARPKAPAARRGGSAK